METYTVIGVWLGDRPIPVGVISGIHDVSYGDNDEFPDGLWATNVEASSEYLAQFVAVDEMKASL